MLTSHPNGKKKTLSSGKLRCQEKFSIGFGGNCIEKGFRKYVLGTKSAMFDTSNDLNCATKTKFLSKFPIVYLFFVFFGGSPKDSLALRKSSCRSEPPIGNKLKPMIRFRVVWACKSYPGSVCFQTIFYLTLHRSHSTAVLARLDWVETVEFERHQPCASCLSLLLVKAAQNCCFRYCAAQICMSSWHCQQTQVSKTIYCDMW